MSCTQNCNQGRTCSCRQACELPITLEDEPFNFDYIASLLRDFFALVGFILMIGLIAFFFGFKS